MSFVIRKFKDFDAKQIATLFYETIHAVNSKDYTREQVNAWAPQLSGSEQEKRIKLFIESLGQSISYVADDEGTVIGFADISEDGYLDFMYVHKDHQRQGVASALLERLEEDASQLGVKQIWANVSITAKPFFEHREYVSIQAQTVNVHGVLMNNFRMEKTI